MKTQIKLHQISFLIVLFALCCSGCATSEKQVQRWEKEGNVTKLSEVAREKSESALIRKKSLESLARLNWKPSNEERFQVYSLFASEAGQKEALSLMQSTSADQFSEIDKDIVSCSSLLDANSGTWRDDAQARPLYEKLRSLNGKAVTISLCQQIVARPELQTPILLLSIKLGVNGSEEDLTAVLFEYGDKEMAEDYLNCGSYALSNGGARWANEHGYSVMPGSGSNRSGWGQF